MLPTESSSFGQWLRQRRRALDLTQEELARALGCAKGTVRKWEADELRPSKQLAQALAERLGIAVAERDAFVSFARGGTAFRSQPLAPAPGPSPWREVLRKSNLPHALTSFVGRTGELGELQRLLETTRLLTLTGAGGIGKTRLALQFAGGMLDAYRDGVWLVEFASVDNAELVPQTITAVFGIRDYPGRELAETLRSYLRTKQLLLVLDNCEHLIQPIAQIAETLLQSCSALKLLATSREALGIGGETSYLVPPLSAPKVPMVPAAVKLQPEAVQLFMERALAVQPAPHLTAETGPLIAGICMRLDGIPLAIELAAARLRTLSLEEISARLDDRFRLLTSGSRTSLPRQQTLRATLDWSYALLSETERALFSPLSVFAGGWTLEAAEAVCADERIPASAVLDTLSQLVDKSLVLTDTLNGETRYRMLETTRQYARDMGLERNELPRIRDRHLTFFLRLAEESEAHIRRSDQAIWLNRLEAEHDNLRAALDWSRLAAERAEAGLRLAAALGNFWETRGYWAEGRERLTAALGGWQASLQPRLRAKALYQAGHIAFMQGDYDAVQVLLEESISIYRHSGEAGRLGLGHALIMLGDSEAEVGKYERAFILINEGLDVMRALGDELGIGRALWKLGACVGRVGEYARALQCYDEALLHLRPIGDNDDIALALTGMAEVALRQGDHERAQQLEQESIALRREVGDRWGIAASLGNLAWIALLQGDWARAASVLAESLSLRYEIGDRGGIAWCLEKLAEIALLRGTQGDQPDSRAALWRATHLFAAASALRASIGSMRDPFDRPVYERHLDVLRAHLDPATFAASWAEGQSLSLDAAVALALDES